MTTSALLRVLFGIILVVAPSKAATVSFYTALDDLDILTSGIYAGQANPNVGRLTLLFNHGDHFHGIGAYSYTGPAGSPTVIPTSTNNRIPEISSAESPLPLLLGTGLYAGALTNYPGPSEYSDIALNSFNQLDGFGPGTPETILFQSSNGRWNTSLAGSQIALELLSITPGLNVGTLLNTNIFGGPGSSYLLGDGSGFEFTPVFWTNSGVLPGTYSVTMRLIDLQPAGTLPSGEFTFDFEVASVPEPGSVLLIGVGLAAIGLFSRHPRFLR